MAIKACLEKQWRRCHEQLMKSVGGIIINPDEMVDDPTMLADPDSHFCEFNGVQIHHKTCTADTNSIAQSTTHGSNTNQRLKLASVPMVLLHGFGSSVFSWQQVMKPLALISSSKILAFDRPAFGLTSSVFVNSFTDTKTFTNPYSTAFSVLATSHFIDMLAAEKTVLIGHSAGSYVAVQTYFQAPQRVAALILVAPAILGPIFTSYDKVVKQNKNNIRDQQPFLLWFFTSLSQFITYFARPTIHFTKESLHTLYSLFRKVLSESLRSSFGVFLARFFINHFGIAITKHAWFDSNKMSNDTLNGYTKPLRSKGWDRALAEHLAAFFDDSVPESAPPLSQRLGEISCPVLIITGDSDPITPSWNSERLHKAIPGSCLQVIKNCGHIPHEEKAQGFVTIVDNFLHKVVDGLE